MKSGKQHTSKNVGAVLVVGGGIAGMQSSLDLANSGFKVYLVDTAPAIGGVMAQLDKTFPTNDCSMCIMAPKLVDVGRHPNIELITYADIKDLSGKPGNFNVTIAKKARYVDPEKCTGCGVCAQECPIEAISIFNEGLSDRKCIYVPYPQAVPLAFTIDKEKCIGCGLCQNLCLADAITYDDTEKNISLDVGSIILSPGFDEFESEIKSEYGHGRFDNVLTSIEFERVLSASGPYKGHVLRRSDGVQPEKIAWIQCVGSRDRGCGNNYCSSVCCTYAIKEAVIAKEHVKTIKPTIFYMDMRTYGKDFEAYYNRSKDEYGVRFVRCRVSDVREDNETKNLIIRYETEDGRLLEEEFDMVVLSVGFMPKQGIVELSKKCHIDLDEFGFCKTETFAPVDTSAPGIFVCGAFQGPKDIPETVMQASAAAAKASNVIYNQRNTLVTKKTVPKELTVADEEPRIGVFICHCGINIGGYVDVPAVVEYAKTLDNVAYAERNLYTCSQDTQKKIVETVKENKLNRVIVASCTPRTHEPLFQATIQEAGLNPHLFEMANIRDQCSWVHMDNPVAATKKAKSLVRMAVAKARLIEPLPKITLDVIQKALIIGGGVSGMAAALSIADQGYEVVLVEKEKELGGMARRIQWTIQGEEVQQYLNTLIHNVKTHKKITVFTNAKIEHIEGYIGNYKTTIHNHETVTVDHGVVIVATGAEEYKPTEYLYGKDPRVITQLEFEETLAQKASKFKKKTIVMIQCVGSRDEQRPYCSRVCCMDAVKNAIMVKEKNPDAEIFILYRDMRTYGVNEKYYEKARELGIIFIRYDAEDKPIVKKGKNDIEVKTKDLILHEPLTIHADYVVLSTGIIPRKGNEVIAQYLKVPLNTDGFFLEAHVKLRPVDFATEGVFLTGLAHSPKSIGESISQAYAAAARALTIISQNTFTTEATIAQVNTDRCSGCGVCLTTCPYNAIELTTEIINGKEKTVSHVLEGVCKGCGSCTVTCPSGAIEQKGFKRMQIQSMIDTAL